MLKQPELRKLFIKYMDFVSLQEGDFYLDVPDLSEEEQNELEKMANEIIYVSLEEDDQ